MSATLSFTGNSSILTSNFYPELVFDGRFTYSCALLEFTAYNSIPNITNENNLLYFLYRDDLNIDDNAIKLAGVQYVGEKYVNVYKIITPVGAYEYKDLIQYLIDKMRSVGVSFSLSVSEITSRASIYSSVELLFNRPNSVHSVLGFDDGVIPPYTTKDSERVVTITSLNVIAVECDIVSGSYTNGRRGYSIHEFAPAVQPGFKIIEVPKHIIYLPLNRSVISSIQIKVVDQDGNPIDFRGEKVTCRIHIKKD